MTELTETAQRVLSELEEAGFEDLTTLLLTVTGRTGSDAEFLDFQHAISELARHRFVKIAGEALKFAPRSYLTPDDAVAFLSRIHSVISFRTADKAWVYAKSFPETQTYEPEARLTPEGRSAARKILGLRGYQWWKQNGA